MVMVMDLTEKKSGKGDGRTESPIPNRNRNISAMVRAIGGISKKGVKKRSAPKEVS